MLKQPGCRRFEPYRTRHTHRLLYDATLNTDFESFNYHRPERQMMGMWQAEKGIQRSEVKLSFG